MKLRIISDLLKSLIWLGTILWHSSTHHGLLRVVDSTSCTPNISRWSLSILIAWGLNVWKRWLNLSARHGLWSSENIFNLILLHFVSSLLSHLNVWNLFWLLNAFILHLCDPCHINWSSAKGAIGTFVTFLVEFNEAVEALRVEEVLLVTL